MVIFIWVEFLPAVLKSPCDCASSWVWVPGEALLALERLCAACTPVEGMNSSGGSELQSSRLTGATDKTEAMLDQQPKTNQVKQQPHSSSGCWARLTRGSRDSQKDCKSVFTVTHTGYVLLALSRCVWIQCSKSKIKARTAAWMELRRTARESEWEGAREGGRSVCERMKERASWGFNSLFFPDCYTSDSYCAKHSCLWGWCQFHVPQLLFSLTSTGLPRAL